MKVARNPLKICCAQFRQKIIFSIYFFVSLVVLLPQNHPGFLSRIYLRSSDWWTLFQFMCSSSPIFFLQTSLVEKFVKIGGILATTYQGVLSYQSLLIKQRWQYVILDEGKGIFISSIPDAAIHLVKLVMLLQGTKFEIRTVRSRLHVNRYVRFGLIST